MNFILFYCAFLTPLVGSGDCFSVKDNQEMWRGERRDVERGEMWREERCGEKRDVERINETKIGGRR